MRHSGSLHQENLKIYRIYYFKNNNNDKNNKNINSHVYNNTVTDHRTGKKRHVPKVNHLSTVPCRKWVSLHKKISLHHQADRYHHTNTDLYTVQTTTKAEGLYIQVAFVTMELYTTTNTTILHEGVKCSILTWIPIDKTPRTYLSPRLHP